MMKTRELDWRQRQKTGGKLVDSSDRVHSEYRMTLILKGGVRGRQERWMELLDKGRQGSDRWGNVQVRHAGQGQKECDGI
jgi:hypothetical protein